MTEEDQQLVARAALHGARFIRIAADKEMFWSFAAQSAALFRLEP